MTVEVPTRAYRPNGDQSKATAVRRAIGMYGGAGTAYFGAASGRPETNIRVKDGHVALPWFKLVAQTRGHLAVAAQPMAKTLAVTCASRETDQPIGTLSADAERLLEPSMD